MIGRLGCTLRLRLLGIFWVALWTTPIAQASPRCEAVVEKVVAIMQMKEFLELDLDSHRMDREKITVSYQGPTRDGRIGFSKASTDAWHSNMDVQKKGYTPQGDPRWPIALLGPELAVELGFRIWRQGQTIFFQAPDAVFLGRKIKAINRVLKSWSLEPISFLPVRTGFLNEREAIQLALRESEDILLHFPYADRDPVLAIHEISWHLSAMLYSRKILQRAREINQITQDFIDFLQVRKEEIGVAAETLVEEILAQRTYELDAGTADFSSNFAALKMRGPGRSLLELVEEVLTATSLREDRAKLLDQVRKGVIEPMNQLSRPQMTPLQALVSRLLQVTRLDPADVLLSDVPQISTQVDLAMGLGRKVDLSDPQREALQEIIMDFIDLQGEKNLYRWYDLATPEAWALEFSRTFDQRVEDLLAAARATLP